MKMRTAGQVQRNRFAAIAFILAFLACGAALASDVERQIPLTRDAAGSGLTMEISREGTRQTATPIITLTPPTVRRVEDLIAKMTARLAEKGSLPSETTVADSASRIALTETAREGSGRPETVLSSLPPVPKEITFRGVKGLLKELRASRKEKPVPAVVVTAPEERLGRTDPVLR